MDIDGLGNEGAAIDTQEGVENGVCRGGEHAHTRHFAIDWVPFDLCDDKKQLSEQGGRKFVREMIPPKASWPVRT